MLNKMQKETFVVWKVIGHGLLLNLAPGTESDSTGHHHSLLIYNRFGLD